MPPKPPQKKADSLKTKQKPRRSHKTLSISQKLEVLAALERGVRVPDLMLKYGVGQSTIYDVKYKGAGLKSYASEAQSVKRLDKRQTLKKPALATLDAVLYKWFCSTRAQGKPISGLMIIEKAKALCTEMDLQTDIQFSDGWLRNFKQRHGIRVIDVCGEKRSADHKAAKEYSEIFAQLVKDHDLTPDQMYNADETGLYWRCVPTRTLAGREEKAAAGFKMNKERITLLLCGNASGRHRIKLFVIGKYKKPHSLRGIQTLPVIYDAQGNAWMNAELFKHWFFHHFVPAVKEHFRKIGLPEDSKCVLLLDNCTAHPPAHELVSGNIFVTYLPANVTSLIQPMDQGICQKLKESYKKAFSHKLVNSDDSVKDFQKNFSLKNAIYYSAMAWDDVKDVTLKRAWRKLYDKKLRVECNKFDHATFEGFGDEDEEEQPGRTTAQQIQDIVSAIPANHPKRLTEEEINEWLDQDADLPGVQELSDAELIESVLHPEKQEEEEEEEDKEEAQNRVTWSEAVVALEKFVTFSEKNTNFTLAEVMHNHILLKEVYKKRHQAIKQADIRDLFKNAAKKVNPQSLDQVEPAEPGDPRLEVPAPVPEPQPGPSAPLNEEDLLADDPPPLLSSDSSDE